MEFCYAGLAQLDDYTGGRQCVGAVQANVERGIVYDVMRYAQCVMCDVLPSFEVTPKSWTD